MNSINWILLAFLSFSGFHSEPDLNQKAEVETCNFKNIAFDAGEIISYKIYYNWNFIWLPAGEVVFTVKDKEDLYHLSAKGVTYKSYEWIYKVRDFYDSYIHKETLLPELSIRDIEEGKYRKYDKTTFHRDKSKAVSLMGKTADNCSEEIISLEKCTYDVLSSVYVLRNIDVDLNSTGYDIPIRVYLDRKIYPLTIRYKGVDKRKRVKGMGPCETILFEPELIIGNLFTKDRGMKVWVSNDQNRIPLLIESPVSVGSIKAVLQDYQGLKYPLVVE